MPVTFGAPLKRAILVGVVLVALDGLVVGQGALTFLIVFVAILIQLAKLLRHALRRERSLALARLAACGIYTLTLVSVVGFIRLNTVVAERRALAVVSACKAYKARHGQFPKRLEDLVPAFLPAVPRAKYTLMFNRFAYWDWSQQRPPRHVLVYVAVPPVGRRLYILEEDRWSKLD